MKQTYCFNPELDKISNIIEKFRNRPSIQKIKENITLESKFSFPTVSEPAMR